MDDDNRPRVHPGVSADAPGWIRWADTNPPWQPGAVAVQLRHDATEAVYVNGVWISPGEIAWVDEAVAEQVADLVRPTPDHERRRAYATVERAEIAKRKAKKARPGIRRPSSAG